MKQFLKLTFIGLAILIGITGGLMVAYKTMQIVADRAVEAIEIKTCYNLQAWVKQSNLCQPDQETIDMCKDHNIIIK